MRKPVFRVSDKVRQKTDSTATGNGRRLEILDWGCRGIVLSKKQKQRALFCMFVFAYAKIRVSHDVAQLLLNIMRNAFRLFPCCSVNNIENQFEWQISIMLQNYMYLIINA